DRLEQRGALDAQLAIFRLRGYEPRELIDRVVPNSRAGIERRPARGRGFLQARAHGVGFGDELDRAAGDDIVRALRGIADRRDEPLIFHAGLEHRVVLRTPQRVHDAAAWLLLQELN